MSIWCWVGYDGKFRSPVIAGFGLNKNRIVWSIIGLQILILSACTQQPSYGIDIYFVPATRFTRIESNYRAGNEGFFWVTWNEVGWIQHANILLSTEITQGFRDHLLREELTQSLGLMNDSARFSDSIFYSGESYGTFYLPIDRQVVTMLYQEAIQPNLTRDEVKKVLGSKFNQIEMTYFQEVALVSEYGENAVRARKWQADIPIRVHGNPTEMDLIELERIINEVNHLLGGIELMAEIPDALGH